MPMDMNAHRARRLGARGLKACLVLAWVAAFAAPAWAADDAAELPVRAHPGDKAEPEREDDEDRAVEAPERPADKGAPRGPAKPVGQTGVRRTFPQGTADHTLREAFRCALDFDDADAGFECYANLNVEANRDTETALTHLQRYQWRFFRQRAKDYVVGGKTFALKVSRRDPKRATTGSKRIKIFLVNKKRHNPAPIVFQWEEGAWRIYANSL